MKKLGKFLIGLLGFVTSIEVLLVPITLLINHKEPAIINEKHFLLWDAFAFLVTCILTSIIVLITKPEKHENKNRR